MKRQTSGRRNKNFVWLTNQVFERLKLAELVIGAGIDSKKLLN
jgi:hypothetical protein